MDQDELRQILNHGESQTTEFKRSLGLQREGLEDLCGMVNAESAHGIVVFGAKDTGQPIGVDPGNLDKAQLSMFQHIQTMFQPPLAPQQWVLEESGARLLVLGGRRNPGVAYHEYDGRAFIRVGTATRQLTLNEKLSLQRTRNRDLHPGPWQCDRCGSIVGNLCVIAITANGPRKSYNCNCGGEYWPAL